MRCVTFATVVAVLFASSGSQAKPTELASISVSLTVQETCIIQSTEAAITLANQPAVSCLHGAPFQISQAGLDPVARADETPSAPLELTFVPTGKQTTVWTVNF